MPISRGTQANATDSTSTRMILAVLVSLGVALAAGLPGCVVSDSDPGKGTRLDGPKSDWPEVFRIGFFGEENPIAALAKHDAMVEYLEDRLGIPVEAETGISYTAVIEAMRAGHVDAFEVGPFSYIMAVREANAEAVAVLVEHHGAPAFDPELLPYYFSVIFTRKGSGIESLDDLRGKQFSFVDQVSTSGHLMPRTILMEHGIDPEEDLLFRFAGAHPTSALAVWNGSFAGGATNELNLAEMARNEQIDYSGFPDGKINRPRTPEEVRQQFEDCPNGEIALLAFSDPIPETPFAIRRDLPESFKIELRRALIEMKDYPEVVANSVGWYVDPTEELGLDSLDEFYNPIRELAKILDLDLKSIGEG